MNNQKKILFGVGALFCLFLCGTWQERLLNLSLTAVLWQLSLSDRETYRIPLKYPVLIFLLGILKCIIAQSTLVQSLVGTTVACVPLLFVYVLCGGRSLGGGDVKLMAAAGFYLGGTKGLTAVFLGCLTGSVWELWHRKRKRQIVALGPYLSFGIWLTAVF